MTDWAEIGKSIVPGKSVTAERDRILANLSAGNEQQLQARVEELLGSRFLVPDTARAMLKTQDIGVVAALPKNIVEVLNMQSPVHEPGVLVREGHILSFVPDNVSLKGLSEACGGRAGKKLYSEWFIKERNPIAALTLSQVGQSGHWLLIPDKFPPGTESKGFDASAAELKRAYGQYYSQADVISFTTALLLNEFQNRERLYPDTWAWCRDPRLSTLLEDAGCFGGGGRSSALYVGGFSASGLDVYGLDPGDVFSTLGCAASWNFGT